MPNTAPETVSHVQFKRRTTAGNNDITLDAGEPYYNMADKHLYIGNSETDNADSKKHIAQITAKESNDNKVEFSVGEDDSNTYSKVINNVANANNASNADKSAVADDVTNLSFSGSHGTHINLSWGTDNSKSASFDVTTTIPGKVDEADKVTTNIKNQPITDIFEANSSNGISATVKRATIADSATKVTDNIEDISLTDIFVTGSDGKITSQVKNAEKATSADSSSSATDVTTSIGNISISSIFKPKEGGGITSTVKQADNATKSTSADKVNTYISNVEIDDLLEKTGNPQKPNEYSSVVKVASKSNNTIALGGVLATNILETGKSKCTSTVKKATNAVTATKLSNTLPSYTMTELTANSNDATFDTNSRATFCVVNPFFTGDLSDLHLNKAISIFEMAFPDCLSDLLVGVQTLEITSPVFALPKALSSYINVVVVFVYDKTLQKWKYSRIDTVDGTEASELREFALYQLTPND